SVITGALIISFSFTFGQVLLGEGYNIFDPYADTEFAQNYTPGKFKNIKEGMSEKEVIAVLGEPISKYTDSTNSKESTVTYYYTGDGYLRKRPDKKFALTGDLAWFG